MKKTISFCQSRPRKSRSSNLTSAGLAESVSCATWLGTLLALSGKNTEALEQFRLELPDARLRVKDDPDNANAKTELVMVLNNIASCQEALAKDESTERTERLRLIQSAVNGFHEAGSMLLDLKKRGLVPGNYSLTPEGIATDEARCKAMAAALAQPPAP